MYSPFSGEIADIVDERLRYADVAVAVVMRKERASPNQRQP